MILQKKFIATGSKEAIREFARLVGEIEAPGVRVEVGEEVKC